MTPRARTAEEFGSFCQSYGLTATSEALPLYLTWLKELGASAREIGRTIQFLDTDARERGEQPWSKQAESARWLQGAARDLPYGRTNERADPIYNEHLSALADACQTPTPPQRLQATATILANATGLPASALAVLTWRDVRLRADHALIEPPPFARRGPRGDNAIKVTATERTTCPLLALRDVRSLSHGPFILGGKGKVNDSARVGGYLSFLPAPQRDGKQWQRQYITTRTLANVLTRIAAPPPQSSRDLALLTFTHAGAMRSLEAITLQQRDVTIDGDGLRLRLHNRRDAIHIRPHPRSSSCPVSAWAVWQDHLRSQGRESPELPAFLRVSGSRIWERSMIPEGLAYVMSQRVNQAGLSGHYTFSSLRIGAIRGWIRDGRRELLVARDAGLLSLSAVQRHQHREQLLSRSIAGQVGL